MWQAVMHGFILAFGLILPLGVQNVFIFNQGAQRGWLTWKSKPQPTESDGEQWTAKKQVIFALSVSLLNPHAILDTIGVIGTSSLAYSELPAKIAFTLSCIGVSWIWFASLAYAGKLVGQMGNSDGFIVLLNKVSAAIMWGSALYLVLQL